MGNPLWCNNVVPTGAGTGRVSQTGEQAVSSNLSRTSITFQNLGTDEIYVRLDATTPTSSNAHYILAAPASSLGGDGGFLKVDGYTGSMKVHAGGSTFTVQVVEYQTT
ncbi:MAG TPA: hypothetical protein DEG65_04775 [Methylophaga sp.]|nr:hypothetical protein [Methylophaga sp.]|tara:strand:+ start:468 stop:791 length:324 start_codon:yes stop_codon:yes gene_type:complete